MREITWQEFGRSDVHTVDLDALTWIAGIPNHDGTQYASWRAWRDVDGDAHADAHVETALVTSATMHPRYAYRWIAADGRVLWTSLDPAVRPMFRVHLGSNIARDACRTEALLRDDGLLPRLPPVYRFPGSAFP